MKKRMISTLAGVATVTAASGAMALTPQITDVSGGGTTTPHNPYQIKFIATEMYNNLTGVNSNNVEFFARLGGDVSKGDSVNIKGYSADVNLGSGNLFLLGKAENIVINKSTVGGTIGTATTTYGLPTVPGANYPIIATVGTTTVVNTISGRATGTALTVANMCDVGGTLTAVAPIASPAGGDLATYAYIADSNATGVVNQVTMLGVDLDTFCKRNLGGTISTSATALGFVSSDKVILMSPPAGGNTYVSTAQGALDPTPATLGKVIPSVQFGLNLNIYAGLNPVPDCLSKDIKLHLVTNQETINPQTVLQIIPQFTGVASTTALQQELSTNDDFKKFISANNAVYSQFNRGIGSTGTLFDVTDLHFSAGSAKLGMFRSFVPQTATAALSFKLTSLSAQAGVTMTPYSNLSAAMTACTKDATSMIFTCGTTGSWTTADLTNIPVQAADGAAGTSNVLNVANAAVTATSAEMIPTTWTASDFALAINGVTDYCVTPSGGVGSWYGGIEAIVPFVKTATGYETYIKLFNRYTKAAKLYIADMNQISDSIVTSIKQLPAPNDSIATGSFVTISGTDLVNGGVLTTTETGNGAPIKFLIRVPAQMGNPAFTTLATTNVAPGTPVGSAAGVATASVVDPYINGIVIQVTPNGSQRSIPLTFKSFKQGQYN